MRPESWKSWGVQSFSAPTEPGPSEAVRELTMSLKEGSFAAHGFREVSSVSDGTVAYGWLSPAAA